jgi:hypothetical protein
MIQTITMLVNKMPKPSAELDLIELFAGKDIDLLR